MSYHHFRAPAPGAYTAGREFLQETKNTVGYDNDRNEFVLCSHGYTLVRDFVPISYPEIRCASASEQTNDIGEGHKSISPHLPSTGGSFRKIAIDFPVLTVQRKHSHTTLVSNYSNTVLTDHHATANSCECESDMAEVVKHHAVSLGIDNGQFMSTLIVPCLLLVLLSVAGISILMSLCNRREFLI